MIYKLGQNIMSKKFYKITVLSVTSVFYLGQSLPAYTSYMEFVDDQWVNRTLSQLCSDVIDYESEKSHTTSSLDLSTSTFLFGAGVISVGIAAAPAIRYVGENYIWHPLKWCYHKVANRNPLSATSIVSAEDILCPSINFFYKELVIKLEKSIWDISDKINNKDWVKKVKDFNGGKELIYDNFFYTIKMTRTYYDAAKQPEAEFAQIEEMNDVRLKKFLKSSLNLPENTLNTSTNSIINTLIKSVFSVSNIHETGKVILNFGKLPVDIEKGRENGEALTFAFTFKHNNLVKVPLLLVIENKLIYNRIDKKGKTKIST